LIRRSLTKFFSLGLLLALVLVVSGYLARIAGLLPVTSFAETNQSHRPELRGVWVQHRSITTPEKIDEVIRRAEMGHLEAIFANIFVYGQALYNSRQVPKYDRVDPTFDPLAYLIEQAHRRRIKVHAWFVNGPVGYRGKSAILAAHPAWSLVGSDGKRSTWLNLARPEVGQFTADLVMEVVEKYAVDGIHFDFFRFPGPEWGFDPDSAATFWQETGLDLDQLRYPDLPAYASFNGNPLRQPTSAQTLATFQNGEIAVALNIYGEGQVILLNWNATERQVAVGSEILQRSLNDMSQTGEAVYVLSSETNAVEYGDRDFERAMQWLSDLGWQPQQITEPELVALPINSVLILPNIYLISPQAAADLARFVKNGGNAIFIDGPVRSIHLKDIQTVTGMSVAGSHFQTDMLMTATGAHRLIPQSERNQPLATYQKSDEQWKAFRRRGLSWLLAQIYQQIKAAKPELEVSVTITADQKRASQEVLQDWPAWLEGRSLDRLIPRGFVESPSFLTPVITTWQPLMRQDDRIVMGLISFNRVEEDSVIDEKRIQRIPKTPEQLIIEVDLARQAGSNGVMLFQIDYLTPEQLKALSAAFLTYDQK
jgi:uncharacterized lipoprotein YddW (UPF0748 family)